MQRAIREKFTRHTLMCIAHKLNAIMSFDMVIVMHEGTIAEMSNLSLLSQDSNTMIFRLMKHQSTASVP